VSDRLLTPPEQMRVALVRHRRAGMGFTIAWVKAWRAIRWPHSTQERHAHKEVLAETRPHWQAAYERTDRPQPCFGVLRAVVEDAAHTTEPRPGAGPAIALTTAETG